jgi:putative two-component system response regulator
MLLPSDFHQAKLLIVDDQEANVFLLEQMLAGAGYAGIQSSRAPETVAGLHREQAFDLILLDLQMPGMDGFQVMEQLRADTPDGCLPVLVITAQPGHKLRALAAGAMDFVSKPFDLVEVLARVHNLLEVRLLHKQLQETNEQLEARVRERTMHLQESYLETIFTLTRAAEHKDEDTGHHVQRISFYSRELAVRLGMAEAFIKLIYFASPMHDIGKIGIPDRILLKPCGFTPAEKRIMEAHAAMGARILGKSDSPYLKMGAEIAQNHHERWDGTGYPGGLKGAAIPLTARIMNICDIYDALRSKRPYKPALSHVQAGAIIIEGDGRTLPGHFDPDILLAFQRHAGAFEDIFEAYAR